jgi:hypothetical protein
LSAPRRRLLWSSLALLLILASGFVPPQAVGLAPTAGELAQRFAELGARPEESAGELVDRLGIGEPDLAVLRTSRPGDQREALDLFTVEGGTAEGGVVPAGRPAALAPMDATGAEWLQLMWKPTDPWLVAALDRLARRISPGAETIMWTLKDRMLPEHEVFEIVGTRARGWEAGSGPWAGGSPAGQQAQADAAAALGP